MDPLREKLLQELEEMQATSGRMLRSMSLGMLPFARSGYHPPVDVYQAEDELFVYCDLAGAEPESIEVVAAEQQLRIRGRRVLPPQKSIACIHQLEIELGPFERTISLPAAVDVERVASRYSYGILTIILSCKRRKARVHIPVTPAP